MSRKYDFAESILFTQEELQRRTHEVARQIAYDYRDAALTHIDNPLVLVCVLKGSFMFTADLSRALSDYNVPTRVEFICVSSYIGGTSSSGQVRMLLDTRHSVEGRHVLIVEDIIDTASTLIYLHNLYKARNPASLKTVVLLDKPTGRKEKFHVDYVVTVVPNAFVIGYGLDYGESYREVRDVVVLHPSVYMAREQKQRAAKKKLKEHDHNKNNNNKNKNENNNNNNNHHHHNDNMDNKAMEVSMEGMENRISANGNGLVSKL